MEEIGCAYPVKVCWEVVESTSVASLHNGCQRILRGNAAMLCIVQEMYAHINAKINIFEGIGGHMQYKYKLPEL